MARAFNGASHYATNGKLSLPLPISWAGWMYFDALLGYQAIIDLVSQTTERLNLETADAGAIAWDNLSTPWAGPSLDVATWTHLVITWRLGRTVIVKNGDWGARTDVANSGSVGPMVRVTIGGYWSSGIAGDYLGGRAAHHALWGQVLSAGDILALSRRASPMSIRRNALRGYWKLKGSDPERDELGQYPLTLSGPTPAADIPILPMAKVLRFPIAQPWSRRFNGTNQYATSQPAVASYPFTLTAWVRCESGGDTYRTVLRLYNNADSQGDISVEWQSTRLPSAAIYDAVTLAWRDTQNTAGPLALNGWSHVAAIFTSATSRRVVVDGDWANATENTGSAAAPTAGWNRLEVAAYGPGNWFNGQVAHVAVYTAALTEAEVDTLAAGGHPYSVQNANCVNYWPMPGNASPEPDSKNNYDLTLYNSPAQGIGPPSVDEAPASGPPKAVLHRYYAMME